MSDGSETKDFPPGDYCIAELFGHTTLVGRFAEVELFGSKMLAIEPLLNSVLLPVVYHGGAAIYRLSPCSAEVAYKHQPTESYHLPPSIRAIIPAALLPAPAVPADGFSGNDDAHDFFDDEGVDD